MRDHLVDFLIDGRMILKWIFRGINWRTVEWAGLG
jgi:hypothetical protein